jgi:hypothetical protein
MDQDNKQLFFSHTWRPDNLGRNNHTRVHELVKKMRNLGWTTWFDEEDMGGNIDAAMAEGIDHAEAILVCLTETYCKKVNETAKDPRKRDNCLKEWTYANTRNKLMIPVIMEPDLLNTNNWPPGIVSLYLGSTLYVNASNDDLNEPIESIEKFLSQATLYPKKKVKSLPAIPIQHRPAPLPPLSSTLRPLQPLKSLESLHTLGSSLGLLNSNKSSPTFLSKSNKRRSVKKMKDLPVRSNSLNDGTITNLNLTNRLQRFRSRWNSTGQLQEIVL